MNRTRAGSIMDASPNSPRGMWREGCVLGRFGFSLHAAMFACWFACRSTGSDKRIHRYSEDWLRIPKLYCDQATRHCQIWMGYIQKLQRTDSGLGMCLLYTRVCTRKPSSSRCHEMFHPSTAQVMLSAQPQSQRRVAKSHPDALQLLSTDPVTSNLVYSCALSK